MLRLELISNMQDKAVYNYFPEQKKEYGTIGIHKETGEVEIKKVSANDEHRSYLFHAVSRIEKYFKENIFPEKDVVAWY